MAKGNINVSVENIFPLIKKFLYSDHEIFLRELISNATDATLKLKHLTQIGESKAEYGNPIIEVKVDKEAKKIHIIDQGLGMSQEEVEKYINQVAFSGAEEFLDKYKDSAKDSGIIGHFGLGFYSAFMVAEKVEIITKSHREEEAAAHWICDGSPEYSLEAHDKKERGTEIILHIAEDSTEFLESSKILELLNKYNKFMPVPIKFGTQEIDDPEHTPQTIKDEKGEETKEPQRKITVDKIVNNPSPAWIKQPSELEEKDYMEFYRELYPMQFDQPLFHIHLNVDYPFNLTGILFFPKLGNNLNIEKDKIQLYQNQVYVTDEVKGIVPEFLTLLKGVIDSPDIPLNVSRSYLQADGAVKKISKYISKKVADKMASLLKDSPEDFKAKWNDIKVVIEYGMISDDKFYEKSDKFCLYPTTQGEYLLWDELVEKIKDNQTDKDGNLVVLYTSDPLGQDAYIQSVEEKGYQVLLLDSPLVPHLIQKLESSKEKVQFARVDADHINNLIKKDETVISKLDQTQKDSLKKIIEEAISDSAYSVTLEDLDSTQAPFAITQPEFMRRMKDMQQTGGGGMFGMGGFPDMYNLVVNANSDFVVNLDQTKDLELQKQKILQGFSLAKLSQNLLKGKDLTDFVRKNFDSLA